MEACGGLRRSSGRLLLGGAVSVVAFFLLAALVPAGGRPVRGRKVRLPDGLSGVVVGGPAPRFAPSDPSLYTVETPMGRRVYEKGELSVEGYRCRCGATFATHGGYVEHLLKGHGEAGR